MCLDDQVLSSYIDGELQEPWKTQVEEHISHCRDCKARYEYFVSLQETMWESRLRNEEITVHQERVWKYLEKTCMPAQPYKFRHRRITFSGPALAAAAAALVLLIGANVFFLVLSGGTAPGDFSIPVLSADGRDAAPQEEADPALMSVSARTHQTAAIAPQELTVEDLLYLLNLKGFEVELKRTEATAPVSTFGEPVELRDDPFQPEQDPESIADDAVEENGDDDAYDDIYDDWDNDDWDEDEPDLEEDK